MRDIVIFGPTHKIRELGLLFWDAGLLPGAVFVPSEADVGSAKKQREHPPVPTGLKIALHGLAGIIKNGVKPFFLFLSFTLVLSHIINQDKLSNGDCVCPIRLWG